MSLQGQNALGSLSVRLKSAQDESVGGGPTFDPRRERDTSAGGVRSQTSSYLKDRIVAYLLKTRRCNVPKPRPLTASVT